MLVLVLNVTMPPRRTALLLMLPLMVLPLVLLVLALPMRL